MDQYNKISSNVFVSFITQLPEIYKIDSNPMEISTSSTNINLSDLMSQILNQEQKFDFLINGEFLRGNLKSHILKYNIQTEKIIQIQYFLSIKPPSIEKEIQEDDWVSGISSYEDYTVSSLFNGQVSIYKNNKKLQTHLVSQDQLKTIKINENSIYTGGLNCLVNVFNLNKNQLQNEIQLQGSQQSIESLDINPINNNLVCAGSFDSKLFIWKIEQNLNENIKKKIKQDATVFKPILEQKIHNDSINCVNWAFNDSIVTGGSDHTIKLFDVNKKIETIQFQLRDSICSSLDVKGNTILNGNENGLIKLWDIRQNDRSSQQSYQSHKVYVSQIKFHQKSDNLFSSCSYDNTIKIWDIRSQFPLFTIKADNKLFALEWQGDDFLLSGGQDKKISIHKFQQ